MFKDLYTEQSAMHSFVTRIVRHYTLAHHWDDHDYGVDNGDKTYKGKLLARQALQEYFPVYELGPHGDYQSFSYGQADFFLLDSRSQRDPNKEPDGPDKSMLDGDNYGPDGQLQWLKNLLGASEATWKFIFSPVVFNPTPQKSDTWFSFMRERQEILDFVKEKGIEGVIVISGDLHAGGIDDGTHSGLPEMLVPAANMPDPFCLSGKAGNWTEGFYGHQNKIRRACNGYGVVTVTTNPDRIRLEVKGTKGKTKISYELIQP
jgi:alkaline phosphatase D